MAGRRVFVGRPKLEEGEARGGESESREYFDDSVPRLPRNTTMAISSATARDSPPIIYRDCRQTQTPTPTPVAGEPRPRFYLSSPSRLRISAVHSLSFSLSPRLLATVCSLLELFPRHLLPITQLRGSCRALRSKLAPKSWRDSARSSAPPI